MRAESSLWIWPFELEQKIGEGGMGVVYRGRYVKNDHRVAVKLIPDDVADKTILARFEREVEILKTLRHPNIVHSFGGVCEDKRRFYAMELVDGGSLDSLLKSRGGSLPWERAVEYGLQMCAALQYAHERDVVHRDIKPANFLLTKDGKLKLSDFGLAIVASGNKLTASGKTVGSFRYMAPEQIRGRPEPVPQTDLYALGCVLFQMIVGEPPFDGDNAAELLNRHLTETPRRVAKLIPETPAALDELIASLLEKDLNARPPSAANVAAALQAASLTPHIGGPALSSAPIAQTPVAKPADRRPVAKASSAAGPSYLTLLVFVIAVGLGLLSWTLWTRADRLRKAEDLWVESFQSNDPHIRTHAALALGKIAVTSDRAYETLKSGLDSDDAGTRAASLRGLEASGSRAKPLIPRLIAMQKQEIDPAVRARAATAYAGIQNSPPLESSSGVAWMIAIVLLFAAAAGGYIAYKRRAGAAQ